MTEFSENPLNKKEEFPKIESLSNPLNEKDEDIETAEELVKNVKSQSSVGQEQVQDLIFSRELGWQEILYDLINTEQLDPWDLNLTILTDRYLKKIQELEEADFFVSSKVLLAAALLLRIKSEILLNKYIKSIDEILFGKKEESKYKKLERIELEDEIPELIPRSPMPRYKKVTLKELIESLNKAITTENRRIKKEILNKNALRETSISLPKRTISIKDKIAEIYNSLLKKSENPEHKKISFTDFVGTDKDERVLAFSPLLHLENQNKVWLAQKGHFDEIDIWLKKTYLKHNPDPIKEIIKELEAEISEIENGSNKNSKKKLKEINEDFENPIGDELE